MDRSHTVGHAKKLVGWVVANVADDRVLLIIGVKVTGEQARRSGLRARERRRDAGHAGTSKNRDCWDEFSVYAS